MTNTTAFDTPEAVAEWVRTAQREGVDCGIPPLRLGTVLMYRRLAFNDARKHGMPCRAADGTVASIATAQALARMDTREKRLREAVEAKVEPLRLARAKALAVISAGTTCPADDTVRGLDAPLDLTPGAGETHTPAEIVQARRERARRNAIAAARASQAKRAEEVRQAELLAAVLDEALHLAWELHRKNLASHRANRDRLIRALTRTAVRHHPRPAETAVLIDELVAAQPAIPQDNPWTRDSNDGPALHPLEIAFTTGV